MINTISESTSSDIQTNTGPKTALWSLGVTQRILCACLARQHHSHVLVLEEEPKSLTSESNKSQCEVSSPSSSKRVPVYPLGIHMGNLVEFEAELKSAGEKLIVVDFSATWCGPCKMIKPFFHSLCEKYGDVVFIEIDVDDAQDVASHCDVKCMPTFQFYKNGKKVQEFSGANKEKLEETIKSLV